MLDLASNETIVNEYRSAFLDEFIDNVGADESCASGN
jgi:hypothetical protein